MRIFLAPFIIFLLFGCGFEYENRIVYYKELVEVGFKFQSSKVTPDERIPIFKNGNFSFKLNRKDSTLRIDKEPFKVRRSFCAKQVIVPPRIEYTDPVVSSIISSNRDWGNEYLAGSSLNPTLYGRNSANQLPAELNEMPFGKTIYMINQPSDVVGRYKLYITSVLRSGKILKDSTEVYFEP